MAICRTNNLFNQVDLSSIRHFFWIVTYGGFSKAARATGVSQPALSLGLQKLEKNLGTRLIERSTKELRLTDAGHKLFSFCQRVEGVWEATAGDLNAAVPPLKRRIRVGSAYSIGMQPLVQLCENISKLGSHIDLEITSKGSFELVADLLAGAIDAAILPDDIHDSGLSGRKLVDDDLVPVAAFPIAQELAVRPWKQALERVVLITYPRETPLRSLVDLVRSRENLKFKSMISVDGLDSIKLLATRGVGLAFVLRSLVSAELMSGALSELRMPVVLPRRGAVLATRRGKTGDELADLLVRLMKHLNFRPNKRKRSTTLDH